MVNKMACIGVQIRPVGEPLERSCYWRGPAWPSSLKTTSQDACCSPRKPDMSSSRNIPKTALPTPISFKVSSSVEGYWAPWAKTPVHQAEALQHGGAELEAIHGGADGFGKIVECSRPRTAAGSSKQ